MGFAPVAWRERLESQARRDAGDTGGADAQRGVAGRPRSRGGAERRVSGPVARRAVNGRQGVFPPVPGPSCMQVSDPRADIPTGEGP